MTAMRVTPFSVRICLLLAGALVLGAAPSSWAAQGPTSWSADAGQTVEFQFTQAGAKTTGRFRKVTAAIDFAPPDLTTAKFDVTMDLSSAETRDKERDAELKGSAWFDVAKFASARYVATQFTAKGTGFEGQGKLSLHGVTRDVPISFTFSTATEGGQTVAWLKGSATVKRTDFGIGASDAESLRWVAPEVLVSFNLRLLPRAATATPAAANKQPQ